MGADLVEFEASGLAWRAEAAPSDTIRREIADRLMSIESVAGVEVLKRNLVRTVLRVPLASGGRVIVKRYAVRGLRDWIKYSLKPSRAKAEWTTGRALHEAGIPTAVPLAMAERRGLVLSDAALVTREIVDSVHLNAYVGEHFGGPEDPRRAALYDDLARIVRRMHDAGFVHNDLHGGNVLVNGPPEAPKLFVIDLHSVSRRARPSEGARWFDLAKLAHSMMSCSTAAERERLCRVYEETGGPSGTRVTDLLSCGALSAELEPQLARMERARAKSRTARAMTRSSKFAVSRADGLVVHHLRTVPPEALPPLLAAHRATLSRRGQGVLKDAKRSALTRQTIDVAGVRRSVIVKEFRCGSVVERMKNAVRRSRAVASWLAGNGLLVRRFGAAEPLALVLRGRGFAQREAYVVMEDLGEDARADLVALARYAGALDSAGRREKRAMVLAVARLFRDLHAAGVYHGDLKAVNLFVQESPEGPRVVLADYDRVVFDREVSMRRRVKNLAQLSASVAVCISLADRLRFFREYAADDPERLAAWKKWFRRVTEECRRKIVVRMEPIE
jgi:tRNA A-37 threonylcarbamoyl transferase component Bud32